MSDQQTVTSSTVPVLESMTLGMILDKAIHLYSRNFLLLIAITAIPQVMYSVGSRLLTAGAAERPGLGFLAFVLLIFYVGAAGISGGAMTMVVGSRYLGKDITFGAAYGVALHRAGPIIGGTLLSALFIFLGLMGLVVPGIILAVSYTVISPVIMLEGVKGAASLKRSRLLMQGYRWQALLLYLMSWCAIYGAVLVLSFLVGLFGGGGAAAAWVRFSPYLTVLMTIILGPFSSVLSVLLYYNQRIRKEGFDLAFLAEAMAPHVA